MIRTAPTIALAAALLLACSGGAPASIARTDEGALEKTSEARANRTEAIDRVFGVELSEWIVSINNNGARERPALPAGVPASVRVALDAVFTATVAARAAGDAALDARSDALADAVVLLNTELIGAGLDYALDSAVLTTPGSRSVLLFSFSLQHHRRYRTAGGRTLTVHWAERLDQLAYRYQLVGFTGQARDPLILTAVVDELLAGDLLPVFADADRAGSGSAALDEAIGRVVARELATIAGRDAAPLATLVGERLGLFEGWNDRFASRGFALEMPRSRHLDWPWREQLGPVLETAELDRLGEIEARLAAPALAVAFATLREQLIGATEHHELQHQIDVADGETFESLSLAELGINDALSSEPRLYVAREISAQLAEIGRAEVLAPLTIVRTIRRATSARRSLERIVSRSIIGVLSGASQPLAGEELEVAALGLLGRSAATLAREAREAWSRVFKRPLASLTQVVGVHGAP